MTRALPTLEQAKAELMAARAFQVWLEDHVPAADHAHSEDIAEARRLTDDALAAVVALIPGQREGS